MKINIEKLKSHPEAISTLVDMWHKSLGHWMPEVTFDEIEQWYREWVSDTLPLAYVAFDDATPVASFSLQMNDGVRPDLFPWLGDVIVTESYRNRGIGRLLIKSAMEKAYEMGFSRLYLFTFEEGLIAYYSKVGWSVFATDCYANKTVTIMSIDLDESAID